MKENRMGTMPIPQLVIKTGVPLMFSLLIYSLYNFVDSIFVSHISENALTALSLAAPVQALISTLGSGIAIGTNSAVSRMLGKKDHDGLTKTVSTALFLGLCAGALVTLIGLPLARPYFMWQSGDNLEIVEYGTNYLHVCLLFSIPIMGQWLFDHLIMASGRSHLFIVTLSASSLTNLMMDPILIFGLLGVPAMGTAGAALSTGISQCVGCLTGFFINKKFNKEIPLHLAFKPNKQSFFDILKVGLPTAFVRAVVSFQTILVNSLLIAFSSTAVAVFGVCAKIQGIACVGTYGIDNGTVPITAYNYGAKRKERIYGTVRWAMTYAAAIFAVFLIFLEGFPGFVMEMFDASSTMLEIGIPALRILSVSWLLAIPCMVLAAAFQGLGRGTDSMLLTLSRQAVLPLVLVALVSPLGNLNLVWWMFSAAELLTLPLGIFLWNRAKKKTIEKNT